MHTLRQYLTTLDDPRGLTRTLRDLEPCRDAEGQLRYTAGNSAAVFRIRLAGRLRTLRCYARPPRHLQEIYGEGYLPRELYLYDSPRSGTWVDTVLGDWIEGETLQETIRHAAAARDTARLRSLAEAFDRLAAALVADDRAHGDLKPENIVVAPDGTLHPIDLDASFLPAFAGETSPELGTAAFQHPARTVADFDARLDDYPAALITAALHALALDPTLLERHSDTDGLLFTPRNIRRDEALREVLDLFERTGRAAEYRIARLLLAPTLRLPELPALYEALLHPASPSGAETPEPPELFAKEGLWGYRTATQTVVPPLYDCGFDFTEGLAAVRLGRTWHYIDPTGRTRINCPGCEAVKPFRDGRATILRDGRRSWIDRTGAPAERTAAETVATK